ncbi:MAG TPA: hypothetical protein VHC22_05745 [Pirellulales bacterium]|nr:hypothetical protein [Pirellulales bacterium]
MHQNPYKAPVDGATARRTGRRGQATSLALLYVKALVITAVVTTALAMLGELLNVLILRRA